MINRFVSKSGTAATRLARIKQALKKWCGGSLLSGLRNSKRTSQPVAAISNSHTQATTQHRKADLEQLDFLRCVNYEIRTPINAIIGYLDLLEEECWGRPHSLEMLSIIKRNSHSLVEIINNLRDYSKIGMSEFDVNVESFSPGQFFRELETWVKTKQISEINCPFQLKFSNNLPTLVKADVKRYQQVLYSLLKTGVRNRQAQSLILTVSHSCSQTQGLHGQQFLHAEIKEQGKPLTAEQLQMLHAEPGEWGLSEAEHAHAHQGLFSSLGLSMNINRSIITVMGGSFEIRPVKNFGNVITISLPVEVISESKRSQDSSTMLPVDKIRRSVPAPAAASRAVFETLALDPIRVLLVEDGVDNQRLIKHVLRKVGMEVEIAENGMIGVAKTLAALEDRRPYDVVLMDIHMPVMDGYEATAEIRKANYQGPIIALTAHAMKSDRDLCMAAGCDDYTTKPINRAELVQLVQSYVGHVSQKTPFNLASQPAVELAAVSL